MGDGFGTGMYFSIRDDAAVINSIAAVGGQRDGADNSGALVLSTYLTGIENERLRITSAGNVGIGITNPQQQLAVGNTNDQIGAGVSGTVSTLYFGNPSNSTGGIARLAYDRSIGTLTFTGGTIAAPVTTMTVNSVTGVAVTGSFNSGGNLSTTASTPFIVGSSATPGIIYYGSTGANSPVKTLVNNTVVTDVTSTGLAVTGALSTTGAVTVADRINASVNFDFRGAGDVFTTLASGAHFYVRTLADVRVLDVSSTGLAVTGSVYVPPTYFFRYDDDKGIIGSGTCTSTGNATQLGIRAANDIIFATGGATTRATITSSGNFNIVNLGTGLVYSNSGTLTSTNPSDSRLKTDIADLSYGLSSILALRPVSYKWKSDTINQGTQYGFIAQEVQAVMPELVKEFETTENGETVTRLGLEKEGIYAALVKSVQELNANLVAQVEILSQRLAALEA